MDEKPKTSLPYYTELTATRPPNLGKGDWHLNHLTEISVLFGRNGSGKSQLLRSLCRKDLASFHYASPERGGSLNFDPGIAQREGKPNERQSQRLRNYAEQFRMEAIARIQTLILKKGFHGADGLLLPDVESKMTQLLPGFNFSLKSDVPYFELKRDDSGTAVSELDQISSGEAQLFGLGLDLLTISAIWKIEKRASRVLLVDEPDLHLHPDLQQQFARFLASLVDSYAVQIILATHSTTLLSALGHFGGSKTSVVYLTKDAGVFKAQTFSKYHSELATCFGGHALMGPLFAFPLLLVEGDDDYRVWAQAARSGGLKLAVLPSNGDEIKSHGRALEALFSALLERAEKPSAYLLRDRDKAGNPTNPLGQHVKRLRLDCHETENLYLSDEVLERIGVTWERAEQKILSDATKHGQNENRLVKLCSEERRTADLKDLMDSLVSILDPKGVDWRQRIGQVLGSGRPSGQLAEFLGEEVVQSFWPSI